VYDNKAPAPVFGATQRIFYAFVTLAGDAYCQLHKGFTQRIFHFVAVTKIAYIF